MLDEVEKGQSTHAGSSDNSRVSTKSTGGGHDIFNNVIGFLEVDPNLSTKAQGKFLLLDAAICE